MNRSQDRIGGGFEALQRELKSGRRYPFYLLYGEEGYERDAACAWLVEKLAPEQARDFNLDRFYADEFALRDFLQVYASYPLMADHRLVVLRNCEKLSNEACKGLEVIVDSPSETTLLIAVGEKLDLRRRFFRQLVEKGRAVEFRPPYENQVPQWLQRHARQRGMSLDPEAAELLRLYAGNNLRELASELDKLAILAGEEKRITREQVEQSIGALRSVNVFQLTEALGRRDYPQALVLLRRLLDQGEEPGRALGMIARHFQLLLKAKELSDRHLPRQEMARQLGISPYFLSSYLDPARSHSRAELWAGLSALREADLHLKSQGQRQDRLIMDILLARLARVSVEAEGAA